MNKRFQLVILGAVLVTTACGFKSKGPFEGVVARFLKAKTNAEREALVRPADVEKGWLKKAVPDHPISFETMSDLGPVQQGKAELIRVVFQSKVVNGERREDAQVFFVAKADAIERVDLGASLAAGDMTWDEIRVQKPAQPVTVRMELSLSEHMVADPNTYPAGEYYGLQPAVSSVAFRSQLTFLVKKESPAGKAVFEALKDGGSHLVILKIKGPNQASFFKRECEVIEFVQEGWVE